MGNKSPKEATDKEGKGCHPDEDTIQPQSPLSTANFIIQFIQVEDVPKADMFSESDPFIESYLTVDHKNITDSYRTPFYNDNKSPKFNSYRNFYCSPPENAVLVVKVFDYDNQFMSEELGWLQIKISDLNDETIHKRVFHGQYHGKSNQEFTLTFRRVYVNRPAPIEKVVFFIRHGESKWNKAQDDINIGRMIANHDHALTGRGCHQARLLNIAWKKSVEAEHPAALDDMFIGSSTSTIESLETGEPDFETADGVVEDPVGTQFSQELPTSESTKTEGVNAEEKMQEYIQAFLATKQVYASPLTRAIETALIGLAGHEALSSCGVTLYSMIREIKGPGGMDTVGICYGDAIRQRVQSELLSVVDRPEKVDAIMKTHLHVNDAQLPWWTPQSTFDSKADVDKRVDEVLNFIRYEEFETAIFVGHSLFFKRLCSRHVSHELLRNRPELAANLKKHKLSNATVLAATIRFSDDKSTRPRIKDAELMFGGRFHIHGEGGHEAPGGEA